MRYSIEPRDRRYVKGFEFLTFAKKIGENISNKYSQKLVDSAIKSGAIQAIQKTAEATGSSIGNKIADKISSVSKKPAKMHSNGEELHSNEANNEISKERYISPKERLQVIDELILI